MNINAILSQKNIIFVLLALISLRFLEKQYLWTILLLLICCLPQREKKFTLNVEWMVLFLSFASYYLIFQTYNGIQIENLISFFLGPLIFYFAGSKLIKKSTGNKEFTFEKVVIILLTGSAIFATLCIVYKLTHMSLYDTQFTQADIFFSMKERYVLNVWNGALFHPTNLNSQYIFVSITALYFIQRVKKVKQKIWFVAMLAFMVWGSLTTASRTNLYIFLVMIIIGYLVNMKISSKKSEIRIKKKTLLKMIGIAFLLMVLALLWNKISQTFLSNTALFNRINSENLSLEHDGRWERMERVYSNLLNYPFGNMPFPHAHNLFLDIARVAGIFPMVFMIIYFFMITSTTIRFLKNKLISQEVRLLGILLFIGMFISFMIEPVLEGRPYIFMMFCFINGMMRSMVTLNHKFQETNLKTSQKSYINNYVIGMGEKK
ncbi:hypothetical protein H7K06_17095 [Priestia aryabhattai]|uniref:O-antigen ligase family protein n=1 Tax=Priestia aryabhattai TaxID=412384 RepID=UPI001C8E6A17|nr:hypothetical protein [Priestia aryabhattai]MBX9969232.1 hypothetical protein [Priestia aryabhattai]